MDKALRLTKEDLLWIARSEKLNLPIKMAANVDKHGKSAARWEITCMATTHGEYMSLAKANGIPAHKARADFKYAYARGRITFPGHEPDDPNHYQDPKTLTALYVHYETAALAAAIARERRAEAAQDQRADAAQDQHAAAPAEPEPATDINNPDRFAVTIDATYMHEVAEQVERQIRCSHAFAAKELNKIMLVNPVDLSRHVEPKNYNEAINLSTTTSIL